MKSFMIVKAVFTATGQRTLAVTKVGPGAGTVVSSPVGIDCGSTCSAGFDLSAKVTLTAVAAAGSSFSGWSGACAGTGTCKVTMSEAQSVTATFVDGRAVVGRSVKIKKGKAVLGVTCRAPSACRGVIKLAIEGRLGTKAKRVTGGSASFSLAAAGSRTIAIQLSRKAMRLLAVGSHLGGRVAGTGIHPRAIRLKLR